MPQVLAEEIAFQLVGVSQIAVVAQHDTERGVHVERLRFRRRPRRAGRWIARVSDSAGAEQAAHVARAKDVAHHAAALVHVKRGALGGNDAGGVLAAVLQHEQAIVEDLVDRVLCHHA